MTMQHPAVGFVQNIRRIVDAVIVRHPELAMFTQAIVASVYKNDTGGLEVQIQRIGAATADDLHYKLLSSYVPRVGDTVICARFGTTLLILGRVVAAREDPFFVSSEWVGNNAPQNIAHGLGATPRHVFAALTGGSGTTPAITEGEHDITNVVVTVTTGWKYRVIAWV